MIEEREIEISSYRAIQIRFDRGFVETVGWRKAIWGLDIWMNNVPILKSLIAANILVWIILWFAR